MPLVKVKDLREGDTIDLGGDEYADPDSDVTAFQYLYVPVVGVELETPECVRVDIEGVDSFGFPPDHEVVAADE